LKRRIELIGLYADAIKITNHDVKNFIDSELPKVPIETLVYFDPPYYQKGQKLYKNHFTWEDHVSLAEKIDADVRQPWIISYDNVSRISDLYRSYAQERFSLNYSANGHYVGGELMIFGENVVTPERVYSSRALVA
jgi:DNA adenine methylase